MTLDNLFTEIEENVTNSDPHMLADIWNKMYPDSFLSEDSISEEFVPDVKAMIMDEVSEYDTKSLVEIFNFITNKKLDLNDLD